MESECPKKCTVPLYHVRSCLHTAPPCPLKVRSEHRHFFGRTKEVQIVGELFPHREQ